MKGNERREKIRELTLVIDIAFIFFTNSTRFKK